MSSIYETKSGFFKARDTVDGAIPSSFAISVILAITINTHHIQNSNNKIHN